MRSSLPTVSQSRTSEGRWNVPTNPLAFTGVSEKHWRQIGLSNSLETLSSRVRWVVVVDANTHSVHRPRPQTNPEERGPVTINS